MSRNEIYLANHSLGRPLDQMAEDVVSAVDLWYSRMDDAWDDWLAEMNRWRANVAKLIGCGRSDAIVPKTSAGQGLRAVLNAFPQDRPVRVITTRGEFDSIDFILKTYAHHRRAEVHWVEPSMREGPVPIYSVDSILDAVNRGGRRDGNAAGLIVVSLVFFGTGRILREVPKLIGEAHDRGWLVLLDLYHAAGVVPLSFDECGADFGVGGSYKYLRGGPGACWLALGPSSTGALPGSLDTGWFAKKSTFGYERSDTPEFAEGGDAWLESTPPILMPYQAKSGLDFVLETGIEGLRKYSLAQQAAMRDVFRRAGVVLFEPDDPEDFGAFSLLHHPGAKEFSRQLKSLGVNTDARGEFVRFGPDILNCYEELERAADIVANAS